jgi:hypothetical protein
VFGEILGAAAGVALTAGSNNLVQAGAAAAKAGSSAGQMLGSYLDTVAPGSYTMPGYDFRPLLDLDFENLVLDRFRSLATVSVGNGQDRVGLFARR